MLSAAAVPPASLNKKTQLWPQVGSSQATRDQPVWALLEQYCHSVKTLANLSGPDLAAPDVRAKRREAVGRSGLGERS
ncbi:hypothetical protein Celaphus_00012075 [Cervus elaphus hippelaphus]|uniref:Uncharacterized protein n=1 Tax=Cervus elaphus hippelaphus TaxID=46360 RepID=A0A212CK83_CEREH|nr:hypothetical protein Celaphus_00012075 [Cervus elaphus hippelaphus]